MVGPTADERAGLGGVLLVLDGLLGGRGLLVGDTLIVRVGKVLTGKGAVEVEELYEAAGDGHAGAALEASGPLGPLLLQYVVPAEALDLVDVGGGELVVRGLCAHGVGEGHCALDSRRLGGDLE